MTSPAAPGRVVVVGASLAGLRTAEALRIGGFTGEVVVIGDEPHAPYDRPPLSKGLLTGTASRSDVVLRPVGDARARWMLGTSAIRLDLDRRRVLLADGTAVRFDGLVIATGARARRLSAADGIDGVHVLRTLDDALALREALAGASGPVAVLGAGFLGSEVAAAAVALGRRVVLADAAALPMLAALGPEIAAYCASLHRAHGVDLRLSAPVAGLDTAADRDAGGRGRRRLTAIELAGAPPVAVPAEIAVACLGAEPNTEWLEGSGLRLDSGVVCDSTLTALGPDGHAVPRVVAAGDVARWPHPLYDGTLVRVEHWSNAVEQAKAAAATLLRTMAGDDPAAYAGVPSFWTDQYDARIQSVGLPHRADQSEVVDGDPRTGRFAVAFRRDGRLVAAAAVNLPGRLPPFRRQLAEGAPPRPEAAPATRPSRTAATPAAMKELA